MNKSKEIVTDNDEGEVSIKLASTVLLIITALCFVLWFALLLPFLGVLAWALTLTIITMPVHKKIQSYISNRTISAALGVLFIALVITVPATLLFRELILAGTENAATISKELEKVGSVEGLVNNSLPKEAARWIDKNFGIKQSVKDLTNIVANESPKVLSSSIWILVQLLLVLFTCFFLLRDNELFMKKVGNYIPLSKPEYRRLFSDVSETIQATVFGNILTSAIQGTLGGLMFWMLGLPAPVLWGIMMAFLSLIPTMGSPLIWIPAAIYLTTQGQTTEAIILAVWGVCVIGLIDNVLYPIFVGTRVRLHTLAVFFFIFGGILLFGTSGLVLGPVALAIGQSLLKIWKARLN